MRKWYVVTAVGALLALPVIAQQKDDDATKPATETAASTEAPAAPARPAQVTHGLFALPAHHRGEHEHVMRVRDVSPIRIR